MEKVYVITKEDYSDYHICAVTADAELAKKLEKLYTGRLGFYQARIEEYTLDEFINRKCYGIVFDDDGSIIDMIADDYEIRKEDEIDTWSDPDDHIICWVFAKDIEHAQKIAQDKRAEYLAKKENIV